MEEKPIIEDAEVEVIKEVEKIDVEPINFTPEMLKEVETIDSTGFKENFDKMYEVTDQIVTKILAEGGTLKQDSYVVREEFGEALAAGYRFLRYQGKVSKEIRKADHPEDEQDYELDAYKEIADVFMMTTSFCRHNRWDFKDKPFVIYRPIKTDLEDYLAKASEVLNRICYHYNGNRVEANYIYEFLEETFAMLASKDVDILKNKIDKFYNKIKKVVE